jgi:hypothetical protein
VWICFRLGKDREEVGKREIKRREERGGRREKGEGRGGKG